MTNRCFSSSQLYALRNEISVQGLIEKTLCIPCRVTEGCFRFRCPLCSGLDTAVNPKTNLARCFHCKKNYNTIDLVMLTRQADFIQSVKFLQSIHSKDSFDRDRGNPEAISHPKPHLSQTPLKKSDNGPRPIGEVLDRILPSVHGGISENRLAESKSNPSMIAHQIIDENRIENLEQQLEYLGRQIEKIARMINTPGSPPNNLCTGLNKALCEFACHLASHLTFHLQTTAR